MSEWSWLYDVKTHSKDNFQAEDLKNKYSKIKYYFKLGGEVDNESDIKWLISGESNSNERDFIWLPPNTNSDKLVEVKTILDRDVDAVWVLDTPIKMYSTGEVVHKGVFKLMDHRNTNIIGDKMNGYAIKDYSVYFKNSYPSGWRLPEKFKYK